MKVIGVVVMFVVVGVTCGAHVTPSEQCPGESFDSLHDRIHVSSCSKSRCKLRKGTNITVNFKFKAEREIKSLRNEVYANIAGVPLPFVGVDGADACAQVTRVQDGKHARCPLAAGHEYAYTNVFPVEQFYPSVQLRVHWALRGNKGNVICFEIPAIII